MTLPRHQREKQTFAQTFERDDQQTISAMDLAGKDIPNQAPATPLRLRRVGVKRRAIPVLIADPFGSDQSVSLSCKVDAFVSLEPDRRGIHVSRIGDLLAGLTETVFGSLQEYAMTLNNALGEAQRSQSSNVAVNGMFTYLESVGGLKSKMSLEHLELFAEASHDPGGAFISHGVGFTHLTACPCVQETYRSSFQPTGSALPGNPLPLLTHTQRCRTRLTISGVADTPTLSDLLACIDRIVVRSQNTLPREFELLSVYRAHVNPQFIEDVMRDLLREVHALVGQQSSDRVISVKSVSLESIHDFDLEAEIEFTVKELNEMLPLP